MMRILQLPALIANQIAAGEVIERPASIVKELLENSLDAKASLINIEIGFGGLNQVKISDNGIGIVADDLPLAIAAHATSKISKLNDLYAISSMGFRGEALASIASVARLSIHSKPAEQEHGSLLECHGDEIKIKPFARTQGTTVDVKDIFFNAPVRKKFLKSAAYEFQAIDNIVRRFAMSAPTIALTLQHNGKSCLHLPAALEEQSCLMRMMKLLGKTFIEQSYAVDVEHGDMHLQGRISNTNFQRSQNDRLWVYINGRMVKDKLVNHAIKQAYDELLYPGRHPACLLYLTLNPAYVDVNVHPTKHEVRFQDPRMIHDFIHTNLRKILHSTQYSLNATVPKISQQISEAVPAHRDYQKISEGKIKAELEIFNDWVVLNHRFIISFLKQESYLVDVLTLHQHWLFEHLGATPFPLASRPLLVPISLDNPGNIELKAIYHPLLQVGIELRLTSIGNFKVCSIPISVPNLNIKSFLKEYLSILPATQKEWISLLIKHESFTTQQLTKDKHALYLNYLQTLSHNFTLNMSMAKRLTDEICLDILNAK